MPDTINTGTGGQAAADTTGPLAITLIVTGLLLTAGAVLLFRRRATLGLPTREPAAGVCWVRRHWSPAWGRWPSASSW